MDTPRSKGQELPTVKAGGLPPYKPHPGRPGPDALSGWSQQRTGAHLWAGLRTAQTHPQTTGGPRAPVRPAKRPEGRPTGAPTEPSAGGPGATGKGPHQWPWAAANGATAPGAAGREPQKQRRKGGDGLRGPGPSRARTGPANGAAATEAGPRLAAGTGTRGTLNAGQLPSPKREGQRAGGGQAAEEQGAGVRSLRRIKRRPRKGAAWGRYETRRERCMSASTSRRRAE